MTITLKKKPGGPSVIQSTSSPSVKVYWINLNELKACLTEAIEGMAARHPEVAEVWLFGSVARGEAVPGSDADLFIVLDDCELPFLERSLAYQPEFCGVGVDVFAYTRVELAVMEAQGHPFLAGVKAARICLFKRLYNRARMPEKD